MTVPARYTLTEAHFRIAELEGRLAERDGEIERLLAAAEFAGVPAWTRLYRRAGAAEAEVQRLQEELLLNARHPDDQEKIDAWWRARSEVKVDGNSRAEYVLQRDAAWERAEAAEAEVQRLTEGLRERDEIIDCLLQRGHFDPFVPLAAFRKLVPKGAYSVETYDEEKEWLARIEACAGLDTPADRPECPQCGGRGTESRSWDEPERCPGCRGTGLAPADSEASDE